MQHSPALRHFIPSALRQAARLGVALLLLLGALGGLGSTAHAAALNPIPLPSTGKEEAVKEARTWVALLDAGNYDESWKRASDQLKKAVSRKKWKTSMTPLRSSLGSPGTRQEKSVELTREVVGAPDAQYAVVEFTTAFANKATATETFTLVWDKDGHWRVSSYAVR